MTRGRGRKKLALPRHLRDWRFVMDFTYYSKIRLWCSNFRENFLEVVRGRDVSELPRFDGEMVLCIGGGPSLWRHKHLDLLAEHGWRGKIVATDRVLIDCLRRGVVPHLVASVDGSPDVAMFYEDKLVDEHRDYVKAVFSATTVHPSVVSRCPFEKYWFVPIVDQPENLKSLTAVFHFITGKSMLVPFGQVGGVVWNIALYLGGNPVLIGYDLSYPDLDITKSVYYKPLLNMAGGDEERVKEFFTVGYNKSFGCNYLLDNVFSAYAKIMRFYVERAPKVTINATEGGVISEEWRNVKCSTFKEVLNEYG